MNTKPASRTAGPKIVLAVLLALSLPALARERQVAVQVGDNQHAQYVNGVAWVVENSASQMLGVAAAPNDKRSFWLSIALSNDGAEPIDVLPEQVSARGDSGALKVFSPEEVLRAQKKRDTWEKVGVALGAAGNQINANRAGYYSGIGNVNGSYRTNQGGSGNFNGTTIVSGYDAAAAQQAQAQAFAQNQALADNLNATQGGRMNSLESRLLRRHTLLPGTGMGGDVQVELPPKRRGQTQYVEITCPIGGIAHRFVVRVQD